MKIICFLLLFNFLNTIPSKAQEFKFKIIKEKSGKFDELTQRFIYGDVKEGSGYVEIFSDRIEITIGNMLKNIFKLTPQILNSQGFADGHFPNPTIKSTLTSIERCYSCLASDAKFTDIIIILTVNKYSGEIILNEMPLLNRIYSNIYYLERN